jgi:diguanylate cyclase (GGDEF)-like protein/PAS domain S-box-containing protein
MGRKPRPAKRKTKRSPAAAQPGHIEQALRESEQMFRATFDQAAVGITLVSLDLRYLRVNDKFCDILGYSQDELRSMGLRDTNPAAALRDATDFLARVAAGEITGHQLRERELVRKDGSRVWVAIAVSLVRGAGGEPRYFVSVIQDISEAKRAAAALRESEERFRQLAHYDTLTNLPNRALFYDRLKQILALAKRNNWTVGVMLVDLDHFKRVNDTLGHAAGDKLLLQAAERLAKSVRASDTVARLGGDEFAVVLSRLSTPADIAVVAQKILAAFQASFQVEGRPLLATLSIGAAVYPDDGTDQDALLNNADAAMYRSKAAGRNRFSLFSAAGSPGSRP